MDAPCLDIYVARYARNICGCRLSPVSRLSDSTMALSICRILSSLSRVYTPPLRRKLRNNAGSQSVICLRSVRYSSRCTSARGVKNAGRSLRPLPYMMHFPALISISLRSSPTSSLTRFATALRFYLDRFFVLNIFAAKTAKNFFFLFFF